MAASYALAPATPSTRGSSEGEEMSANASPRSAVIEVPSLRHNVLARAQFVTVDAIDTGLQQWTGGVSIELTVAMTRDELREGGFKDADFDDKFDVKKEDAVYKLLKPRLRNLIRGNDDDGSVPGEMWLKYHHKGAPPTAVLPNDVSTECSLRPFCALTPAHVCFTLRWRVNGTWRQEFDLRLYPVDTQQLVVDLGLQNEQFVCIEQEPKSIGGVEKSVFKQGRGTVLAFTPTVEMTWLSLLPACLSSPQDTSLDKQSARFPVQNNSLYKQYVRSPVASEWSFLEVSTEVDLSDARLSRSGLEYSHVFFALKVQRQPAFVLGTVFLPYFIITTSLGTAAAVSASESGTRLQITSTLFMTSIAMRYVTLTYLPRISYATLMDVYILIPCSLPHALKPSW